MMNLQRINYHNNIIIKNTNVNYEKQKKKGSNLKNLRKTKFQCNNVNNEK